MEVVVASLFTQLSTFTSASKSVEVSVRGLLSAMRESAQGSNRRLEGDSNSLRDVIYCADLESVLAADGDVTWEEGCC